MRIEGSCTCGNIHLTGDVDPLKTQICHCTDCQTGSGSAFRISIPTPGDTLKITGKLSTYLKTSAESGTPRVQAFCTVCGTHIYSTTQGDGLQPSYTVRVGILKQRDQLVPQKQNWFRSARPWVLDIQSIHKNNKQG